MARFDLAASEWGVIAPLLPNKPRGAPRQDDVLTPGQASDKTTFLALNEGLRLARDVVADCGFFSRAIIELIETNSATADIPRQSNVWVRRVVDLKIYRHRNLVERFFNKLKRFHRIATRFDKLARNYLAAGTLASVRLWMRHEPTT
jgi:transposase